MSRASGQDVAIVFENKGLTPCPNMPLCLAVERLPGSVCALGPCVRRYRPRAAGGRDGLPDEQDREVLEGRGMKATYDRQTDTLTVILRDGVRVTESDEDKPGVILDYDDRGNLVSLEVLDASRRVSEASKMEFQTTG